jgi:hypothetical protein
MTIGGRGLTYAQFRPRAGEGRLGGTDATLSTNGPLPIGCQLGNDRAAHSSSRLTAMTIMPAMTP